MQRIPSSHGNPQKAEPCSVHFMILQIHQCHLCWNENILIFMPTTSYQLGTYIRVRVLQLQRGYNLEMPAASKIPWYYPQFYCPHSNHVSCGWRWWRWNLVWAQLYFFQGRSARHSRVIQEEISLKNCSMFIRVFQNCPFSKKKNKCNPVRTPPGYI